MLTVTIYDGDAPIYVARIGCVSHKSTRPARWFGELLQPEGGRLAYAEIVSYTSDLLHISSALLTALKIEVQSSRLQ